MARLKAAPQQNRTRLPATNWMRTSKRAMPDGAETAAVLDEAPRLQEAPSAIAHSPAGESAAPAQSESTLPAAASRPQQEPDVARRVPSPSNTRSARRHTRPNRRLAIRHTLRQLTSAVARRQTATPGPSEPDIVGPVGGTRAVKLAIVVQRYGQAINGGAELHARYIAEHLARHARGGGADHLRLRLRDVAERAAGRRGARQQRPRPALPGEARARSAHVRTAVRARVQRAALDSRRARVARRRRADQPRR